MKRRFAMAAAFLILLVLAAACDRKSADGPEQSAPASETSFRAEPDRPDADGIPAMPGSPGGTVEPIGPSEPPASPSSYASETEPPDGQAGLVCFDSAETSVGWRLVGKDFGYELESDLKDAVVVQTLLSSPGSGNSKVVQITQWNPDGPSGLFRKDAIVLDFADRNEPACTVYPLFEANVSDSYNVDSVTEAYGFLDADRLLYVAAGDHPFTGNSTYRVQTLDIRTGETEVLFPDVPGATTDEFFARSWLTADKNKLVLNAYRTGKLWTFDLARREVRQSGRRFPHEWPLILTVSSPDGELFWYTDICNEKYRLYDAFGEPVAEMPFSQGFDAYPPFRWTPDGRFAAYAYTRNQAREHVIDADEVYHIAPQGIRFLDRRGRTVPAVETPEGSEEYVELAAWIGNGEEALLHFFKLDRDNLYPDRRPAKITLRYERLRLDTGERTALQTVANAGNAAGWTQAVYVPPISGGELLYRIDTANNRLAEEPSHAYGLVLPDAGAGEWAWYNLSEDGDSAALYRFDADKKTASVIRVEAPFGRFPEAVVHDWLIANTMYIRLGD
jgi:hypothetical protein